MGLPSAAPPEEGLLTLDRSAHLGIRGPLYTRGDLIDDRRLGFAVVSTMDVAHHRPDEAVDRIRARVGGLPVYVSVDIDVLDPAHAPAPGPRSRGGLTSRELQMILRGLDGLNLVGADIVEVSPHAELARIAAANVAYEFLGLFALAATRARQSSARR